MANTSDADLIYFYETKLSFLTKNREGIISTLHKTREQNDRSLIEREIDDLINTFELLKNYPTNGLFLNHLLTYFDKSKMMFRYEVPE